MAVVNVMVNGRAYTIACDDGEEDHLRELAAHIDGRVKELLSSIGQVGDNRLILMAALLVTDDLFDARHKLEQLQPQSAAQDGQSEAVAAEALEKAAQRMEDMAAKFAAA